MKNEENVEITIKVNETGTSKLTLEIPRVMDAVTASGVVEELNDFFKDL